MSCTFFFQAILRIKGGREPYRHPATRKKVARNRNKRTTGEKMSVRISDENSSSKNGSHLNRPHHNSDSHITVFLGCVKYSIQFCSTVLRTETYGGWFNRFSNLGSPSTDVLAHTHTKMEHSLQSKPRWYQLAFEIPETKTTSTEIAADLFPSHARTHTAHSQSLQLAGHDSTHPTVYFVGRTRMACRGRGYSGKAIPRV